ncbi:MAG: beta-N-acetylhexosaminidase [Treponema sp.]|nr:beta-N-acetylhexosaminidase [Treponema sp.]
MKKIIFEISALILAFTFTACSSLPAPSSKKMTLKTSGEIIDSLSLEEKIAQLFVIIPEHLDEDFQGKITKRFASTYERYPVGGFILFARHIKNPNQIRELNNSIRNLSFIPPIIAVDEEGGRVARLARNENFFLPKFESMNTVGKTDNSENARGAGQLIGSYLRTFGFTFDFAPVVDINTNPENIVIGDRSFGSDAEKVAKMSSAFLNGLHSAGIKGCIKHFPGHGDTKGDTHADYVAVTKSWDEIKNCELIPFIKNFESTDAIMTAHVTFIDVDDKYPASLSKKLITDKLRGELGYQGLVLTDALDMGAIVKNYGAGEACVMALEAGNDIILMPKNFQEAYEALLNSVKSGRISEDRIDESLKRILKLKGY